MGLLVHVHAFACISVRASVSVFTREYVRSCIAKNGGGREDDGEVGKKTRTARIAAKSACGQCERCRIEVDVKLPLAGEEE